ncbi:MAG: response regulator, partial [Thermodesulfobacteriota bacterium]|nr:response regulator [Thermodesulfobacteriota bacterium]
ILITGQGRILVMDDEEMVREIAGKMLTHIGYDVEFATNGHETIDLYKKAKGSGLSFDAVIMDLTIPGGMGGKEVIHELLEFDPEIKAIVSSGYSNDPIMEDTTKNGFSGIITKPYKIHQLSKTLYKVINRK